MNGKMSQEWFCHKVKTMRKRYKLKKRSCPICKPHKMKWAHRFKAKELSKRDLMDKESKDI